ncbi:hypothetical protein [Endozoicomonas sp. ALC020]|uniref:hypothetical protein n=1 Tax=unclassified Endozoicomonas TaxID=2644528 RepID=UPI003BB13E35
MENIFSFEYPPLGVIRIVVLDNRLYVAVKDFVPLLKDHGLTALKGCLFHNDPALRDQIIPLDQILPMLRSSGFMLTRALASKLDREVIPEVRVLCREHNY